MLYDQKRPLRLSLIVLVPLSCLMVMFGCMALLPPDPDTFDWPLFTTTRMAETGIHFMEIRKLEAPGWLYRGLHAIPAMLWSLAMPFQHIAALRRKFPAFHRRTGYFILTGSLLLSMTGYTLAVRDIAYSHANPWHLHNFNGASPISWPTFEASLWALGPVYLLTLYKTATTARRRDLKAHEQWAAAHTICAYAISLERLFMLVSYFGGFVLAKFVDQEWLLRALNDLPDTLAAKAEVEMDMFALGMIGAYAMAFSWAGYAWSRAGRFRLAGLYRNTDEVAAAKKAS